MTTAVGSLAIVDWTTVLASGLAAFAGASLALVGVWLTHRLEERRVGLPIRASLFAELGGLFQRTAGLRAPDLDQPMSGSEWRTARRVWADNAAATDEYLAAANDLADELRQHPHGFEIRYQIGKTIDAMASLADGWRSLANAQPDGGAATVQETRALAVELSDKRVMDLVMNAALFDELVRAGTYGRLAKRERKRLDRRVRRTRRREALRRLLGSSNEGGSDNGE